MATPAAGTIPWHVVQVAALQRLRVWSYALLLLVGAAAFIHWETLSSPDWSNDGYTYAIRMLTDRGVAYDDARAAARKWYADKPPMSDPRFTASYAAQYPEYWRLFAPRMLYPWVASLFPTSAGFSPLLTVSNAAYVATILAIFALLLDYAGPETALLLAAICAVFPETRFMGRAALTDMSAVALWAWTLVAMSRYVKKPALVPFAFYAFLATLMTLTRPIPYIPLCAALTLLVSAHMQGDRIRTRAALFLAAASAALCVLFVTLGMRAGAPSFGWVLEHIRTGSHLVPHSSLAVWYVVRTAAVAAGSIVALAGLLAPLPAFIAIWRQRGHVEIPLYLGAIASTVLTILIDPITGDIPRVVVLPLIPIVAVGLALLLRVHKRSFAS